MPRPSGVTGWGGWRRWARYASVALAVAVLLAAGGLVGYRVLAPAEMRSPARTPHPTRGPSATGVISELGRTPLIVDDRLRVFAGPRQVWADGPTAVHTEVTPYWSFRRWPQEVTGVVLAPGVVVTEWSDGVLVALDTGTGEVRWRTEPRPGARGGYAGRRTGAATVYAAPALAVAGSVVVNLDSAAARGYDSATGRLLWRRELAGCPGGGWSVPGGYALACADLVLLDPASGRELRRWRPPGAGDGWQAEPVACAVGRSQCRALRTQDSAGGRTQGWVVGAGGAVTAAPALDSRTAWLAGDVVVEPVDAVGSPVPAGSLTPSAPVGPSTSPGPSAGPSASAGSAGGVGGLVARRVDTGEPAWTWAPGGSADRSPATVVAAGPDVLYLVTQERTLVGIDPASGRELARFPLDRWRNISATTPDWRPGHVYIKDRYLVVERLHPRGDPAEDDNRYYYSLRTVLVTAW
ncbi:MAG TPA: PQQ-binding-like beta-propeller repeat protein [Micromonosporaceae bacterium]|nr:PQQ-binding-like beta-propeller repeat protein [Micromonosporaceae bacterium]